MAQQYTDQQIIQALRAGGQAREGAWEFVYKNWFGSVVSAILNKGGARDDAMDALQEICIIFEERIRRADFVLERNLFGYFKTCVLRCWARTRQRVEKMEERDFEEASLVKFADEVESEIAQADLAELLDESMSQLGERCKKILLLFMNGHSMKEIAKEMEFSGGEQVAKNEKRKCQERYENFLRKHPAILKHIQDLRND